MAQLNDDTIDLILSSEVNENFWFFELGRSGLLHKEIDSPEKYFMHSFLEKGQQLFMQYIDKIRGIICDLENKRINSTFEKVVFGNERELVVALVFALTSEHHIDLAIAIPIVAILLKKPLDNFCKQNS